MCSSDLGTGVGQGTGGNVGGNIPNVGLRVNQTLVTVGANRAPQNVEVLTNIPPQIPPGALKDTLECQKNLISGVAQARNQFVKSYFFLVAFLCFLHFLTYIHLLYQL